MFPDDPIRQFQLIAFGILMGSFLWGWIETRLSIKMAKHFNLLAPVTSRSAHRVPTPTIGGLAIVDTVLIVAVVLNCSLYFWPRQWASLFYPPGADSQMLNWSLICAGAVIGVMGLIDDWRTVKPIPKLAIQVICAIPPAWLFRHGTWIGEDTWAVFANGENWIWVTFVINMMWMMVLINIFNFMDGMDGLAGLFATTVTSTICLLILLQAGDPQTFIGLGELLFISFAVMGACLGFLRFNLPPAQTFMGDVGSQFLGWLLATLALMAHVPLLGPVNDVRIWPTPWAPLLLFLPFLGDGFFTMARRAMKGENILTPHFTHLYQRQLKCGRSHSHVLLVETIVMFACALLTLMTLFVKPEYRIWLGIAGIGVMITLWFHVRAVETETAHTNSD